MSDTEPEQQEFREKQAAAIELLGCRDWFYLSRAKKEKKQHCSILCDRVMMYVDVEGKTNAKLFLYDVSLPKSKRKVTFVNTE